MRYLPVTVKYFTLLPGSSQGDAEGTAHSSLRTLGSHTSAPLLSLSCSPGTRVLWGLPGGCLVIHYSRSDIHPSRLSSYLTCVKRLSFESVRKGTFLFFLPHITGGL